MAVSKINYTNKVSIVTTSVPEINKVTDSNMNEIKSVVNNNADELTSLSTQVGDIGTALDTINRRGGVVWEQ